MNALKLHDTLLFLGVAGLLIPLLRSLHINSILAFLLSGVLLGPYGLGTFSEHHSWLEVFVIEDTEGAAALAELGVVFLLFLIGLELSWERLWRLRKWIFGLGFIQLFVCSTILAGFALLFGNSHIVSLILGACLSLSSTAIVMQLINEQKTLGSPLGQASFSILLFQDLAVIPLLLLMGLLGNQTESSLHLTLLLAFGKSIVAILGIVILGRLLLRPLFRWVINYDHFDAFMALILLVAIGSAVLTSWFGLSPALGAFIAGLLLAETQYRHEIGVKLESFNSLLMGLFFMSVGMNINIAFMLQTPFWLAASILGLMLIKTLVVTGLLRWQNFNWADAWHGGLLLSQAGEFGFIVVGLAISFKTIDDYTGQFMLMVVGGSMFLAPIANKLGHFIHAKLLPKYNHPPSNLETTLPADPYVLIAGCGRVGKLIAEILSHEKQPWIAIEHSANRVENLRRQGFSVIYGNVKNVELMRRVHANNACAMVVTVDEINSAEKVVSAIRTQFPETPIYARARDHEHAKRLLQLGATQVIPDAVEAGLQLVALTLESTGVSKEECRSIVAEQRERELKSLKMK
jgi:CPA2 family monovalent cation:H+ antiporter-2